MESVPKQQAGHGKSTRSLYGHTNQIVGWLLSWVAWIGLDWTDSLNCLFQPRGGTRVERATITTLTRIDWLIDSVVHELKFLK
mmetsp:Transcript_16702/g.34884  ORF Transcript_16702/g.34884 Transcript_16702/m.34884 type:complete len:83 (+) Transcript_16702:1219-1467(+)